MTFRKLTSAIIVLACSLPARLPAQFSNGTATIEASSGGWTDPALSHYRLLQQRLGDGSYKMIGTFKVIGTPYIFGGHNKGDMYAPDAKAQNIFLSYNTYNQEVEFYSTSNPDQPLVKEPGTVDSFMLADNIENGITGRLKFTYGPLLGSKEKSYFLELYAGARFSIYKRYKSDLDYVSTNYVQSELRQFNLQVEYFYRDSMTKTLKKLKANSFAVNKEFRDVKDLSSVVSTDEYSVNPDAALKKAFEYLNK